MNRVLITGAQGFVGRYLVSHLLTADGRAKIFGVGRSPSLQHVFTHKVRLGRFEIPAPLPAELRLPSSDCYGYAQVDIRQKSQMVAVLREFQPNIIIHLASSLRGTESHSCFETNVGGTSTVIEAIAETGLVLEKLVIGSSGAVYGQVDPTELPLEETSPSLPIDAYGLSKLGSENVSRELATRHNIPIIWVRLFNLVGAGQQESHVCGRLASQIASVALGISPPMMRVKSLETTRDFIDVRDVAAGIEFLTRNGIPGLIYNLASGVETSISSALGIFLNLGGLSSIRIEKVEGEVEAFRHFASVNRITALGFETKYDFKDSARDVLNYYLKEVAQTVHPSGTSGRQGK